jgi:5-methylcytosine-specific restriction endonuclease McrA
VGGNIRLKSEYTSVLVMPKNSFELPSPYPSQPKRDSRRAFNQTQKVAIFRRQKGKCAMCGKKLDFTLTDFDHIKPYESGGKTTVKNGQALHKECHTKKDSERKAEESG